jgi:hypothetical protein
MSHRQAQAGLGLDATVAELLAQDGSLLRVTTRIFAQAEPGLRMAEIAVDEGLPGYVGVVPSRLIWRSLIYLAYPACCLTYLAQRSYGVVVPSVRFRCL